MSKHDKAAKEKQERNAKYASRYRQLKCKVCGHRSCVSGNCKMCGYGSRAVHKTISS